MQSKLVVTALGAFGLGALVGWAITADIHENRVARERAGYDRLLKDKTEHIWALQDRVEQDWAKRNQGDPALGASFIENLEPQSLSLDPEPNAFGESVHVIETDDDIPPGETPEETRSNLQKIIDAYTSNPDQRDEFADLAERAAISDEAPPFVIDRETFAYDEEGEHYEKITLMYYPRDRVLLDDEEDPIDDIPGMVGWRSLSQFGGESGDPNVVFVRNRKLMTDFEVVKEEETELPLHVKYGMPKEEFRVNKAAGTLKLRQEDE